jgi:hypothetical protein
MLSIVFYFSMFKLKSSLSLFQPGHI